MRRVSMSVAALAAAMVVGACGTSGTSRVLTGAGIGAGSGAVVGNATGAGTVEGAVVGGVAGAVIGAATDKDRDSKRRYCDRYPRARECRR